MVIKAHIKALEPYLPPLDGRTSSPYLLLDFNERTIPVPTFLTEAIKAYIDAGGLQRYPAYGDLQAQLASYAGVKTEQCMFTNGSDQGIDLIVRCCCEAGTEAIVPTPCFAMHEQAALSEGLVIRRPKLTRTGGFPVKEILELISPKTSVVVLSNPNNPTGTSIPKASILEIARHAPHCAILVDECYFEFMDPAESVKDSIDEFKNLFVCRTFSKTWGMPSLRLGYLLSAEENIRALCCVRGPYDVNQVAVVAARAALANRQYVFDYVEDVMQRAKPKLEAFLTRRNIVFWPTSGNYLFGYFSEPNRLEAELRSRGILTRPKKDAEGVLGLRISIGTEADIDRLLVALEEVLDAQAAREKENGSPPTKKACL